MSYTIRLREEAENDLIEAASWYQQQREGVGHEFLDEVLIVIQSIPENPHSYPAIHLDIRRVVLRKFPFCVFYKIQLDTIIVFAVLHASRSPCN